MGFSLSQARKALPKDVWTVLIPGAAGWSEAQKRAPPSTRKTRPFTYMRRTSPTDKHEHTGRQTSKGEERLRENTTSPLRNWFSVFWHFGEGEDVIITRVENVQVCVCVWLQVEREVEREVQP